MEDHKQKNNIERMDSFINWMENKVKNIHIITDDMFITILEKI